MAIDTIRKRKNVVSVARFWHPPVVVADASLDAGDRYQIGRAYRGVISGGGEASAGVFRPIYRPRRR